MNDSASARLPAAARPWARILLGGSALVLIPLGLAFRATHPADRVVAALGLLLWVVSVLLTFWLARRWFGTAVGCLAAAFYGCNVAMLKAALLGMPYPVCAILLLLTAALVAPS